jgi:hypothetical protein
MGRLPYLAVVGSACIVMNVAAQSPAVSARPYDGIQAGLDAFRLAEAQRQSGVTEQLGDIWGYGAYYPPARQPSGVYQAQTGLNRWESHPVYDPPLTMHRPLPPVDSPWLDGTPYAAPIVLPAPAASAGASEDWIPPVPPNAGVAAEPRLPVPAPVTQKRREY